MLETVEKFLDRLYERAKSYGEVSIYKFQKELYENNGYVVLFDNGHHTVFYKAKDNQFDIEQKGADNMTVRDLYIYSEDKHEFILFKDVNKIEICFKGCLEDCPTELIDRVVYQFRAIDFNIIEVVLR